MVMRWPRDNEVIEKLANEFRIEVSTGRLFRLKGNRWQLSTREEFQERACQIVQTLLN
jgi:hypothetical protein